MSRRGNPYDNAHVESFFKTLKHEEIRPGPFWRRGSGGVHSIKLGFGGDRR